MVMEQEHAIEVKKFRARRTDRLECMHYRACVDIWLFNVIITRFREICGGADMLGSPSH
jgi:hypothetical protein